MSRPRVAVLSFCYFPGSHADVIVSRLLNGYEWNGGHRQSRIEVVSVYQEQGVVHSDNDGSALLDIGPQMYTDAGVPRFSSVAEALGVGRTGVNVDGVVIIGEHGDFDWNRYSQKMYPRRRLYDAAVATMLSTGRIVPIFNDKHLSWHWPDAHAMYRDAQRLDIPLLAGSSLPLTWRVPTDAQWPSGAPMSRILCLAYGEPETYGFHGWEAIQSLAERRHGAETGVARVTGLLGDNAGLSLLDGEYDLAKRALDTLDGTVDLSAVIAKTHTVMRATYRDALEATVVLTGAIRAFTVAADGDRARVACHMVLPGDPHPHFIFLVRQIEQLMVDGTPPYPVERTLLTGGIIDHALRHGHGVGAPETPHLDIHYHVPDNVHGTGVGLPVQTLQDITASGLPPL